MQPEEPHRPPLDPGRLSTGGWRVEVLEECPSTNAYVAGRARSGEPPGLVLVAEHQQAGRGRLDRVWVTPPRAALTVSLLVAPETVPLARWPWLPLLAGLAVRDMVGDAVGSAGVRAELKWPNDVLLDGAKVAGILVERVETPSGDAAVVGIGLNVSSTRAELPVESATSLALAGATGAGLDRTALLDALLVTFGRRFDGWASSAGHGLLPAYTRACSTLGRRVRVELPGGTTLTGDATGVDDDGRLLVDTGGQVHVLGAGDVVHVRPADGTRQVR